MQLGPDERCQREGSLQTTQSEWVSSLPFAHFMLVVHWVRDRTTAFSAPVNLPQIDIPGMCDTTLDVQDVVCVLQWVVPQGSQSAPAAVMEVQSRADARAGGSSGGIFCSSLVYLYSFPVFLRW